MLPHSLLLIFLCSLFEGLSESVNLTSPSFKDSENIYTNSFLDHHFDDKTFNWVLVCTNGELAMYEQTNNSTIVFYYTGIDPGLMAEDIIIRGSPNEQPQPSLFPIFLAQKQFSINTNCPPTSEITDKNYFNKITVELRSELSFSFLLNCDPDNRHKKFEWGYVIIAFINACIIIGVAMHSKIESINFRDRQIRVELKWKRFLFITVVVMALGAALYMFASVSSKYFKTAFIAVRYIGVIVSLPFLFLTANELLYRVKELSIPIESYPWMRPCDLLSLFITLSLNIPAYLLDNLILNNILAVAISIGSIKIFYFKSFKQSCLSMTISTVSVTIVAVVLHYILRRSYNDYAYELSSPLFIQVPDMVDNLYKKCSWLPVLDVLVPGVFLAYLRAYDENLGSKAFGVYTIWGNFFFLASTIVWVFVEAIYPFSVPFCLVTYPSVMVGVALVARIRNDLYKLWEGRFNHPDRNSLTEEFRDSWARAGGEDVFPEEVIQGVKISTISLEEQKKLEEQRMRNDVED